MNKFYKDTKVKIGMDNKESPRINGKQVLRYLAENYYHECMLFNDSLEHFKIEKLQHYLETFPLLSETRKQFVVELIKFRRMKMIEAFKEDGI